MIEFPHRRRIYLMRHGEAAYVSESGVVTSDPRSVPLTLTGREQAHAQGAALQDVSVQRVICSGLPRTRQTAELVLTRLNQDPLPPVETIPDLEEIHGLSGERRWPPADGQSVADVLADIANPWAKGSQPGATFLGGERFSDFEQRVVNAWETIVSDAEWDNALLVLHGAVNRMILNHILRLPWSAEFCIEQDNACLNIIDIDSTQPRRYLVRAVNLTAYNLAKHGIVLTNMEATAKRVAETL